MRDSTSGFGWLRWLHFPRVLGLSVFAALALALPSIGVGRLGEDYAQLLAVEGVPTAFRLRLPWARAGW